MSKGKRVSVTLDWLVGLDVDLEFLRKAIESGDAKPQLLLRVGIIRNTIDKKFPLELRRKK